MMKPLDVELLTFGSIAVPRSKGASRDVQQAGDWCAPFFLPACSGRCTVDDINLALPIIRNTP